MKVICWPIEDGQDATETEVATIEDLFELISKRAEEREPKLAESYGLDYLHEITATTGEGGERWLVLSWLEVQND